MNKIKNIKFWIFDLDNTLYPSSTNLFAKIDKLMASFITKHLNVSTEEAILIKNDYFKKHGTTLNGLIKNHNIDPYQFLEFVHDIDYSFLNKNTKLNKEIKNLPGKKIIFTNGSRKHAKNVVSNLELDEDLFSIFDIVDSDFVPKPEKSPYEKLIKKYDIIPEQSLFFEDIARNLKPAHDLGMRTAWVINEDNWAKEGHDGVHVHFKIKQLDDFLEQCNLLIN
ncbi:MAG: pyrimidine 5'-nucleotidase [Candidatus Fonsibacter sp.]|nr:pyrimidine 5'-nucleotidase [Candidatus Fonsibacter sp.]